MNQNHLVTSPTKHNSLSLKELKVEDLKAVYDFEYVNPARDSKSNWLIHHFSTFSPKSAKSPTNMSTKEFSTVTT